MPLFFVDWPVKFRDPGTLVRRAETGASPGTGVSDYMELEFDDSDDNYSHIYSEFHIKTWGAVHPLA